MIPLLKLKEIGLNLGTHSALNGLKLTVKQGEVHALLGANGAGKSGEHSHSIRFLTVKIESDSFGGVT